MGNTAAVVNRSFFQSKPQQPKEFASVVPVPPSQPPSIDVAGRPSSRKRKPAVHPSTPSSPEAVKSDFADNLEIPSQTTSLPTVNTESQELPFSAQAFDFNNTEGQLRREGMNDCELECSQITKSLFVGGQRVAENLELLKEKEITRVINCSLSITKNFHEGFPGMTYLGMCRFFACKQFYDLQ